MNNQILVEDFIPYALGGRSHFTIKGNMTYHFRISKKQLKDKAPVWFVYCSYNGTDWMYLGNIFEDQKLVLNNKSEVSLEGSIYKALQFVWYKGSLGEPFDLVKIWYDGTCSRCGRKITEEESIKRGLGPTCYLK